MIDVVEKLRRGETPPLGNQSKRFTCMPAGGKTTLKEPPPGPFCRDIDTPPPAPAA